MGLLKKTWSRFSTARGTTLAAAVGYRSVFALAPLLLVAVAVAGALFGEDAGQGLLAVRLEQFLGPDLAQSIEDLLAGAAETSTAGLVGFLILIWAGSGLFNEIQGALVAIYRLAPSEVDGWRRALVQRLLTLVAVLASALGFVLLVGSAALVALIPEVGGPAALAPNFLLLLGGIVLSFRFFTPYRPSWRVVIRGALTTELAMIAAGLLVGAVVSRGGGGSVTGIAGSAVAILLLVYVLAAVYLLGAAFTRTLDGDRIPPVL